MMQLQYGGHYEIADEMETSVVSNSKLNFLA